jgi:hypothetical protein
MTRKTIWFPNYPTGRFANAVFQFAFAKYLERKLNCNIILGAQHRSSKEFPWTIFDLPDHSQQLNIFSLDGPVDLLTLGENRNNPPSNDAQLIVNYFDAYAKNVIAIDGYFQYDTDLIRSDGDYYSIFQEYLLLDNKNTQFQKILNSKILEIKEKFKNFYVIALHIRRGDYALFAKMNGVPHPVFYVLDLDKIILNLKNFITTNRIKNVLLYVATDDTSFCLEYFRSIDINVLTNEIFIDGTDPEGSQAMFYDLAGLASANTMVASNSSFSIFASMLNTTGRSFIRQLPDGQILAFDPWATPILYGH